MKSGKFLMGWVKSKFAAENFLPENGSGISIFGAKYS
jgi:hypothetical protein